MDFFKLDTQNRKKKYIYTIMKWYIFCILIGILLYLFVNNIDRFSIGNPYEISTWGIEDAEPNRDDYPYVPLCDNILNHHKLPINTNIKSDSSNEYNCKYVDYIVDTPVSLPEYLSDLNSNLKSSYKNRETNDCILECEKGEEGENDFDSWEFAPLNAYHPELLNIDCKPTLTFYSNAHGQILVINNQINDAENDSIKNDPDNIFHDYYSKYPKIYLENSDISIITVPKTGSETHVSFFLNDLAFNNKSSYNTNPRGEIRYTFIKKFNNSDPIQITRQPIFSNRQYNTPESSYIYQEPEVHLWDKPPLNSGFNKTLQSQFNHYKNNNTHESFEPKVHTKNLQHDIILGTDYVYYYNNMPLNVEHGESQDIILYPSYDKIKLLSINTETIESITDHLSNYTLTDSYFDPRNLEIDNIQDFLNHERRFLSGIDSDNYLNENEIELFELAERRFAGSYNDRYYMSLRNDYYKLDSGETKLLLCKIYKDKINEIFIKHRHNNWVWVSITDLDLEYYFLDNNNKFIYANKWENELPDLPDKNIEWPILCYWSTLYYIYAYINYKSLKPYLEDCIGGQTTFDIDTYKHTKLFNKDSFINNTPKRYLSYYSKHNNEGFSSLNLNETQKSLIGEYTKLLDYDLICRKELDAFYRLFNTDNFNYTDRDSFYEKEINKYQSGINDYEIYLNEQLLNYDLRGLGDDPVKNEYLKELKILQYNKYTLKSTNFNNIDQPLVLYRMYRNILLLSDVVFYCKNLQLKFDNKFNIQIYLKSCLSLSDTVKTIPEYLDSDNNNRFKLESYYYNPELTRSRYRLNYLKPDPVNIFEDSEPIYSTSEKNSDLEEYYSDLNKINKTDGGAVDWEI